MATFWDPASPGSPSLWIAPTLLPAPVADPGSDKSEDLSRITAGNESQAERGLAATRTS